MSVTALVFGPWQLRHGEPTSPCTQDLEFLRLREIDLACNSLVIDQRQLPLSLFSAQRIPLAAVVENAGAPSIAYLLHAIDRNSVLDIIAEEALVDRAKLTPEATLESLGIASLDIISIVFALEERFGLVLEQSDLEGVQSLGQLVDLILSRADVEHA